MPRFNEFLYNTQKYGDKSKLAFSAEPMVATAINYNWIDISYSVPDGGTDGYVGFRIVRSQDGYPETEDDGVVIYEKLSANLSTSGAVDGKTLSDNSALWIPLTGLAAGTTAPLLQEGQFAYYRAWVLKTAAGDWVPAGDCYTLLPKKHGVTGGYAVKSVLQGTDIVDQAVNLGVISSTHDRFMSYIPTVFTSISNSGLDVPNPEGYSGNALDTGAQYNTLLSSFMSAFSFTVDEMLTFAANTLPPADGGQFTSPDILALQSSQFGVPQDSLGISKTQKRLVRDSIRNYARKGTLKGLQDYVQDVTNYSATIIESGNKVLGHENSTFDIQGWKDGDDVGDWIPTSYSGTTPTATITVDATQTTATVATAIDTTYSAKVVTTASNAAVALGAGAPITKGIPVVGGVNYKLSYQGKRSGSSGSISPTITWYDNLGNVVVPAAGEFPASPSVAVTTSFVRYESAWIAPMTAAYATIQFLFSVANTYWIDMVMLYEPKYSTVTFASGDGTNVSYEGVNSYVVGDVISIRGVSPTSYNLSGATVSTVTYNGRGKQTGFTVLSNIADTFVSGGTVSKYEASPTYAEARGVLVSLNPSKTNYMYNPSFESTANWPVANCTSAIISNGVGALYTGPIGARTSSGRRQLTASSTTPAYIRQSVGSTTYPLPRNKTYTFSVYIRSTTGTTASPLVLTDGLRLDYTDSVDGTVAVTKDLKLTTDWQRVSISLWVPDNAANTVIQPKISGWVSGQVVELDAAQLEIGNVATDYFDGTMTTSGCAWSLGSAYASSSYSVKYVNLSYRLSRLRQGITGFLPINTPWAIEYLDNDASPQQYSGVS